MEGKMKKNLFWKIFAIILALWAMGLLSAMVANNGCQYYKDDGFIWKINKTTGEVYIFAPARKEWVCFNKR